MLLKTEYSFLLMGFCLKQKIICPFSWTLDILISIHDTRLLLRVLLVNSSRPIGFLLNSQSIRTYNYLKICGILSCSEYSHRMLSGLEPTKKVF